MMLFVKRDCPRRAAKKILAKMKGFRLSEATLAELIAGQR